MILRCRLLRLIEARVQGEGRGGREGDGSIEGLEEGRDEVGESRSESVETFLLERRLNSSLRRQDGGRSGRSGRGWLGGGSVGDRDSSESLSVEEEGDEAGQPKRHQKVRIEDA